MIVQNISGRDIKILEMGKILKAGTAYVQKPYDISYKYLTDSLELANKINQLSVDFKKKDYPYETLEERNKRLILLNNWVLSALFKYLVY